MFTLVIENNKYKQTKIVQEIEGSGALVISVEVTMRVFFFYLNEVCNACTCICIPYTIGTVSFISLFYNKIVKLRNTNTIYYFLKYSFRDQYLYVCLLSGVL